ncbi:hypothetical protein PUR56_00165, partial [Streptomyces sp. BE303]|nr:hypothetical protein [Streptomyces sp. BE303]
YFNAEELKDAYNAGDPADDWTNNPEAWTADLQHTGDYTTDSATHTQNHHHVKEPNKPGQPPQERTNNPQPKNPLQQQTTHNNTNTPNNTQNTPQDARGGPPPAPGGHPPAAPRYPAGAAGWGWPRWG